MARATTDLKPHETGRPTERRRGRVDLSVPVHLSNRGDVLLGVTKNVSIGGLFVAAVRCLPIGERVAVRLSILDEAEPIAIEAEVRWSRGAPEGDQGPVGMGLRFIDPLLQAAMFVRVLLRLREPNFL